MATPNPLISAPSLPETKKIVSTGWDPNRLKLLIAGGIAGAVSRTATSPLERLKILRQTQVTTNKYASLWQSLVDMGRTEGWRGYFKGNGTNVLRIAPHSAIQFFSFDHYKRILVDDSSSPTTAVLLTAGALAGMTSSTVVYPLDLVRSCLTVQTSVKQYDGIMDALRKIHAAEGIRGLYKGWIATILGISPYVAVNMTTFDLLKRRYLPERSSKYFDIINLSLGAVAGATAATVTYPTDVVRRRMQLQGFFAGIPAYNSITHCVVQIVKTEGVTGLYKGLIPCYLKVIPAMAISFMTYERLRKWFRVESR